jgi:hypothetical protein
MIYIYKSDDMEFKKIPNLLIIVLTLSIISILFLSNWITYNLTKESIYNELSQTDVLEDYKRIKSDVDKIFDEYEEKARVYLKNKYPDSPIRAKMLRLAAYNAFDSVGVLLPVELALAQAQIESNMGKSGRSPVNNPFNVGEYDSKTVKWYNSTYDGIEAYYYLMCSKYLKCKRVDELLVDMKNCDGYSYASCSEYPSKVKNQMDYISRYIDNRYKEV